MVIWLCGLFFLLVILKACHRVVVETRNNHLNHSAFSPSTVLVYNLMMRKIYLASKYLNILDFDLNTQTKVEIADVKVEFKQLLPTFY